MQSEKREALTSLDQFTDKDLDQMIKEAINEISMRQRVYPRLIINGKMNQVASDRKIELMYKIRDFIRISLENRHPKQGGLFEDQDIPLNG